MRNSSTDISELIIEQPFGQRKNSYTKPAACYHEFYLSGDVGSPDEYIEWFDIIRNCSPSDIVKIHINSPGGDLYTAIQFLRVVADCPGTVITSAEGACMSAATLIFMNADSYEVSPHSVFMFHNYSTGMYGKGGELYDSIMHERKWSESLLREVYRDFLTEEEIQAILENKDIWMDGHEVADRIEQRAEKLNGKAVEPEIEEDVVEATQGVSKRKTRKSTKAGAKDNSAGAGTEE